MSPSLNDLPDVCLLTVFKYISLLELFRTIRQVNTRWSGLLPTELNRRHSLVIVDDREFDLSQLQLDQYQSPLIEHVKQDDGSTSWSRLPQIDSRNVLNRITRLKIDKHTSIYNQIHGKMITTLVDSLPQITSLTLVQRIVNLYPLDQIIRMIDHWRDHLVTLKLCLYHQDLSLQTGNELDDDQLAQMRTQTVALFDSINRAPALKHLTIELDNFISYKDPEFTAPLTILSQLSTIHFDSDDLSQYLYRELVSHATANRALRIGTKDYTTELEELLRIDPKICDKFSNFQIRIPRSFERYDSLNRFCARFSSLVHLKLVNNELAISKLGRCLSQLSQLVHLSTELHANPPEADLPEYKRELPVDQIVPVPSVRLLTVTLHISSHSATEHIHLHRVFPNVQVLSITNKTRECSDCGFSVIESASRTIHDDDQLRECAQLARRPFRSFPRLRTIEIDENDSKILSNGKKLIAVDEL